MAGWGIHGEVRLKQEHFNHSKSSLNTALMLKATQSYLSGTCPCCMRNPSEQEITRKYHVKMEKKVPPSEFLEARLSSLVTFHLATVSNCHGQWNARHTNVSKLGFMCNIRLILNKITSVQMMQTCGVQEYQRFQRQKWKKKPEEYFWLKHCYWRWR